MEIASLNEVEEIISLNNFDDIHSDDTYSLDSCKFEVSLPSKVLTAVSVPFSWDEETGTFNKKICDAPDDVNKVFILNNRYIGRDSISRIRHLLEQDYDLDKTVNILKGYDLNDFKEKYCDNFIKLLNLILDDNLEVLLEISDLNLIETFVFKLRIPKIGMKLTEKYFDETYSELNINFITHILNNKLLSDEDIIIMHEKKQLNLKTLFPILSGRIMCDNTNRHRLKLLEYMLQYIITIDDITNDVLGIANDASFCIDQIKFFVDYGFEFKNLKHTVLSKSSFTCCSNLDKLREYVIYLLENSDILKNKINLDAILITCICDLKFFFDIVETYNINCDTLFLHIISHFIDNYTDTKQASYDIDKVFDYFKPSINFFNSDMAHEMYSTYHMRQYKLVLDILLAKIYNYGVTNVYDDVFSNIDSLNRFPFKCFNLQIMDKINMPNLFNNLLNVNNSWNAPINNITLNYCYVKKMKKCVALLAKYLEIEINYVNIMESVPNFLSDTSKETLILMCQIILTITALQNNDVNTFEKYVSSLKYYTMDVYRMILKNEKINPEFMKILVSHFPVSKHYTINYKVLNIVALDHFLN